MIKQNDNKGVDSLKINIFITMCALNKVKGMFVKMNSKKKTLFLILTLISIVIITLGVTYAFFQYVKEGSTENSIQLGKITFIYEEVDKQGAGIALENAFPISDEVGNSQEGKGKVFHFSIKSDTITNVKIPYTITARVKEGSDLEENAVKINLKDDKGETLTESIFAKLKNAQFETIPEGVTEKVIYKGEVPENTPGYQKEFEFRMWIPEEIDFSPVPGEDGQKNYPYNNKSFRVTINVYAEGDMLTPIGPTIKAISNSSYKQELWAYKSEIEKIVIQNQLSEITGENVESWDISAEGSPGTVKAYYDKDTKIAYIQGDGKIDANADSSYLFNGFSNLKEIEGLNLLDTSRVTNMRSMFSGCSQLTTLDFIKDWDTSSVTDMRSMFSGCSQLTSLDFSSWDTSSVTDMSYMFHSCSQLTSLDSIKDWNTLKVTNMSYMFNGCSKLTNLDSIKDWDTSSVTNMSYMFTWCSKLTNLDFSGWDTSSATSMSYMFDGCSNLTNLNSIQNWDTSSVTDMRYMFTGCSQLTTTINITMLPSKISNYSLMFSNAATADDAQITVNYTTENESLVGQMIGTKSDGSHVDKGTPINSHTVTVNGNEDIQASTTAEAYYPNVRVTLTSESGKTITSFDMNGKKMTGNTFKMPDTDVTITNVVTTE